MKKLYRSDKDKIVAGLIGGIGEYLEIDATILRLIWILITVFTGFFPAFLAYIIAALVVPKRPH